MFKRFTCLLLTLLLLLACAPARAVPAESEYYADARVLAYAQLVAEHGLAVQPGEKIIIYAPAHTAELVALIAAACYDAGAAAVLPIYTAEELERLAMSRDTADLAQVISMSDVGYLLAVGDGAYSILDLISPTFDTPVPPADAQARFNTAREKLMGRLMQQTGLQYSNATKSSLALCPNAGWARRVYPELGAAEAVSALWEDALAFSYLSVDESGAVQSGAEAAAQALNDHAAALTDMGIASLHFVGGDTDITVRLHQPHVFQGPTVTADGQRFRPNIPCEECFTLPEKTGVNGHVAISRPLLLSSGDEVQGLRMTFADGRLTDWTCDTGAEAFAALLETDEGARYLGEVSLVSADTPIYRTGRTYYTTLIDENAACHLALGMAYAEYNLPADAQPDEQVNQSGIHVDFVFGTDDMTVTATLSDGTERVLMRGGAWAE